MRYIVEIDPSSSVGAELLRYIAELNAPDNAIRVHKASTLTDEEMALPGGSVSAEQLEEWLSLPDYGSIEGQTALSMLKEELAVYRRSKK